MEKEYLTFVLGYDLLNNKLIPMPCDYAFELCQLLIEKFLESEEYHNLKISAYEALEIWIKNNEDFIEQEITKYK